MGACLSNREDKVDCKQPGDVQYYGRICYEFRGFQVGQKRIDPTSTEWSQQEEKSMWHGKEILLKVVNDHLRCSQRI